MNYQRELDFALRAAKAAGENARHIRAQPWGQNMLIVAVSGWGQESDRRSSMEAGFDHHFVKPVDIDVLTGLLTEVALPPMP